MSFPLTGSATEIQRWLHEHQFKGPLRRRFSNLDGPAMAKTTCDKFEKIARDEIEGWRLWRLIEYAKEAVGIYNLTLTSQVEAAQ